MKLVTYARQNGQNGFARLGALLDEASVVDLNWGYLTFLTEVDKEPAAYTMASSRVPSDIMKFLAGGEESLSAARETLEFARAKLKAGTTPTGPAGEKVLYGLQEISLRAPVPRPGKILCAGRNFRKHFAESAEGWKERGQVITASTFPTGFIKVSTAVAGPYDPVIRPKVSDQLDYEVELAVVIGRKGKYIPKESVQDYIAGYTIFNDISARDWQYAEMKNNVLMLGKNFDTTAPLGPWLVTKDEIKDPQNLHMALRVNGQERQNSNTSGMIFTVFDLIEHWSKMTLEPGDVITSGTPEGVASHRKPDPMLFYLKPGDIIEAEIEGLGCMRNPVVGE